jgi:hypothetical protein
MADGPSIIRKGADKSNLELTNSLRANFVAAQQDYTPPTSGNNTPVNGTPVRVLIIISLPLIGHYPDFRRREVNMTSLSSYSTSRVH